MTPNLNDLFNHIISAEAADRAIVAAVLLNITNEPTHIKVARMYINHLTLPFKGSDRRPLSSSMERDYYILSELAMSTKTDDNGSFAQSFWPQIMACELMFAYEQTAELLYEYRPDLAPTIQAYKELGNIFTPPSKVRELIRSYKSPSQLKIEESLRAGNPLAIQNYQLT